MALGGKTVQYTLAVDLETGELTAGSSKVKAEMEEIKKATKGVGGALSDLKGVMKFTGALLIWRELSQLFGSALQYARDHNTEASRLVNTFDLTKGKLLENITNSKLFKFIIEQVTAAADLLAGVFGDNATQVSAQTVAMNNLLLQANKIVSEQGKTGTELLIKQLEDSAKILQDQVTSSRVLMSAAAMRKGFTWAPSTEDQMAWDEQNRKAKELLETAAKLRAINSGQGGGSVIGAAPTSIPGIERDNAPAKQFQDLNLAIGVTLPNLAAVTEAEEDMQAEMIRYGATSREELGAIKNELNSMLDSGFMTFINGMVAGFESVGAAIVNGQNSFKSFGAVFLKTIAQLAVQFGTFLILVGSGMSTVGTLFGFSGAGAIAAGIALTVFGGALGALASRAGAGSNSRTREQEQRFRDSKFGTSGSNGTTIINNINFANTIGLTRDSMKEVGEIISKELFKQEKLGRIETVG